MCADVHRPVGASFPQVGRIADNAAGQRADGAGCHRDGAEERDGLGAGVP